MSYQQKKELQVIVCIRLSSTPFIRHRTNAGLTGNTEVCLLPDYS